MKKNGLAITSSFRKTALEFPDKVRVTLATLETPGEASKVLRGGEAMLRLAKDLKASTEVLNAIQHGRLLTIAKLGELMPAGKRGPQAKDNHTDCEKLGFHPNTITAYRKVARSVDEIDTYYAEFGDVEELSMAGFIRWSAPPPVNNDLPADQEPSLASLIAQLDNVIKSQLQKWDASKYLVFTRRLRMTADNIDTHGGMAG